MTEAKKRRIAVVDVGTDETEAQALERTKRQRKGPSEEQPWSEIEKANTEEINKLDPKKRVQRMDAGFSVADLKRELEKVATKTKVRAGQLVRSGLAKEAAASVDLDGETQSYEEPSSPTRYDVLPIVKISESPGNPRKSYEDLEELTASIKNAGVLQPLLVRPISGGFEVVFGHRRLRAAKAAGLDKVPVQVRHMGDRQVLETQLIENIQRSDVHPLEQADAFDRLMVEHGQSAEDIAKRLGKSARWVQTRVQLTKLAAEARRALTADTINVSTALLIARIPSHKLQADAVDRITGPTNGAEPMGVRAAEEWLREEYTTELRGAPFSTKDPYLYPEAGPCTTCPKRSGNNPQLFEDLKRADVCTDVACFKIKVSAAFELKKEKAESEGKKVLPLSTAKQLYRWGNTLQHDAKYVELDRPCADDPKRRTWAELVEKAEEPPQVFVAVDREGKLHELVEKEAAVAAVSKSGAKWAQKLEQDVERASKAADPAKQKRDRELLEARARVIQRVIEQAVETVEEKPLGLPELRIIAKAMMGYEATEVLTRRGLKHGKDADGLIERSDAKKLGAFVFELAITEWVGGGFRGYTPELKALAALYKVDLAKLEAKELEAAEATALFEKGKQKAAGE